MTQHFNSGRVVLAAIVHELERGPHAGSSHQPPGQQQQRQQQPAAAASEVKSRRLGLLGLRGWQRSKSLPRQREPVASRSGGGGGGKTKKKKGDKEEEKSAADQLARPRERRGLGGWLFSAASSAQSPTAHDERKLTADNSPQLVELRRVPVGHEATAGSAAGGAHGGMHPVGQLAGASEQATDEQQQQHKETSFTSRAVEAAARDQVIEFKFDLIVGADELRDAGAAAAAAGGQESASGGGGHSAGQRRLLDSVNELVESFVLDSSDVCLMSLGDCRPHLGAGAGGGPAAPATSTGGHNFEFVLQQTRRALGYAFELLQATSAAAATAAASDPNPEPNYGQPTCAPADADAHTIELGATLIRQRSQSLWFEVTDLARAPPDGLDQAAGAPGASSELVECRNLREAAECLDGLRARLAGELQPQQPASTSPADKSLLLVTLRLRRRIRGGLFHNRMCLMQYDPRLTELSTLFECVFDGQALSHLRRRRVHLETLELELARQFGGASCLSLAELDKQHHHVASLRRLIQAEWLLYKQLSAALIKTLVLVHVQRVNFSEKMAAGRAANGAAGSNATGKSPAMDIVSRNKENNNYSNTCSNNRKILEQLVMVHNLNLLEFASLIQRASASRLRRRKRSLKSHLSNLSINSLQSSTSNTPADHHTTKHKQPNHHHDLTISPTTTTMHQHQHQSASRTRRARHHRDHHQPRTTTTATNLSHSRPSLLRQCSRGQLDDELDYPDSNPDDNYCDTDELGSRIVPTDDDLLPARRDCCSRPHGNHHHKHRQRHHHQHDRHHQCRHHQQQHLCSRWQRERRHEPSTTGSQPRAPRRPAGAGSAGQSRSSSLTRRRSDLTESSSMSTSSSGSNRLAPRGSTNPRRRQHQAPSSHNSPLSSTTMVVGGGGGGQGQGNNIAPQHQLLGGIFSDDTDSIASANLNSCSVSTASYTNNNSNNNSSSQLAGNSNWPPAPTGPRGASQASHSDASLGGAPRSARSRRDVELKWMSRRQASRTMAAMQQQQSGGTSTLHSPLAGQVVLRQPITAAGRQVAPNLEDYDATDDEIAAAMARQPSPAEDTLSEIGSVVQVTEPPKQLKLEQFLTQLSSIIAPMTQMSKGAPQGADDAIGPTGGDNAPAQAQPQRHLQLLSPPPRRHHYGDDDDDDDDCKSHSSILDHLSSLATESNIKLQQQQQQPPTPTTGGHLQRILSEETSAAAAAARLLAPTHASQQAKQQQQPPPRKLDIEQQLRALTIDCHQPVERHQQRPSVVRSSLDSNCPSSASSSSAASSSCCSSSEQRILGDHPPPAPPPPAATATNGCSLYPNPMRHQANVRT